MAHRQPGLPPPVSSLQNTTASTIVINWIQHNCHGKEGEDLCRCLKREYEISGIIDDVTIDKLAFIKIKRRSGREKTFLNYLINKNCYDLVNIIVDRIGTRGRLNRTQHAKLNENKELDDIENGAIRDDNVELLNFLIKLGSDPQGRLDDAIIYSSKNIIARLIELGANVNEVDNSGSYPLLLAVQEPNNDEIIELLIEKGAKVNGPNNDSRPMTMIFKRPQELFNNLQIMLKHGAKIPKFLPNISGPPIETIPYILQRNYINVINLLLKHGFKFTPEHCDLAPTIRIKRLICPNNMKPKWYAFDENIYEVIPDPFTERDQVLRVLLTSLSILLQKR